MSFETARRDIEGRFDTNWVTTVKAFDNVDFKPPEGAAWTRIKIFEEDTQRINIGTPGVHRVSGMIVVEIFVPKGTGTATARDYAGQIATIFRDAQFNGVLCREAVPRNVGDYKGWYQFNVVTRFQWDGVY